MGQEERESQRSGLKEKKPTQTLLTPRLDLEPTFLGLQILLHANNSKFTSDFKYCTNKSH